jgi:hypothetical protein
MGCLKYMFLKFTFFSFIIFFLVNLLFADVVILREGTIINGKILNDKKNSIVFQNIYGTFSIKKREILKKKYIATHKEDLEYIHNWMQKKLKKTVSKKNEKIIDEKKQNNVVDKKEKVIQPIKKIVEKENVVTKKIVKKKQIEKYNMSLILLGDMNSTFGSLKEILPWGRGIELHCNFLPFFYFSIAGQRVALELYGSFGSEYYSRDSVSLTTISFASGVEAVLPLNKQKTSELLFLTMPMYTILMTKAPDYKNRGATFSFRHALGYRHTFNLVKFYGYIYYQFIYDSNNSMQNIGVMAGAGYSFDLW